MTKQVGTQTWRASGGGPGFVKIAPASPITDYAAGMAWHVTEKYNNRMTTIRTISKYLLAIFMVGAGSIHFINPDFYLTIMPRYLPFHLELVYLSGFCEIALGLLLLIPRFSRFAAWGIIALLIAVFPANVYLYQNQDILPARRSFTSCACRRKVCLFCGRFGTQDRAKEVGAVMADSKVRTRKLWTVFGYEV